MNIPQDDGDLNDQYEAELKLISVKPPKETKTFSAQEKQEDYYKGFRSAVVLCWMFSNLALCAVVLSTAGLQNVDASTATADRSTIYMAVVLSSVAGLSAFRFVGAMWFLVVRLVRRNEFLSPHFFQCKSLSGLDANTRSCDYSSEANEDLLVFRYPAYLHTFRWRKTFSLFGFGIQPK